MFRNAIAFGVLLLALAGCTAVLDGRPGNGKTAAEAAAEPPQGPGTMTMLDLEAAAALPPAPLPKPKPPLRHDEVRELQAALQRFGYDPGPVDGLLGSRTLGAVRAYQTATGLPVDGCVSYALLLRLRDQVKIASRADNAKRAAQKVRSVEPAAGDPPPQQPPPQPRPGIFSRIFGPLFSK